MAPDQRLLRSDHLPMTRGVFVTGTDTGVGKTLASAILVRAWQAAYWKPVQSGTVEGTDTQRVQSLAGASDEFILPERYCLQAPVSPHEAARREGVDISLAALTLPRCNRPIVVEGAGGVMVPLNPQHLMIDLMCALDLPVVVVARTELGTINHTLLTLSLLRARGLTVLGVILSGTEEPVAREAIQTHGDAKILLEIPHLTDVNAQTVAHLADSLNFSDIISRRDALTFQDESDLRAIDAKHIWHPFTQHGEAPPPTFLRQGHGATLVTADGHKLQDLISSWWVNLHGHAEPNIATAIAAQAATLEQAIFAGFTHRPAATLVRELLPLLPAGLERFFFSDDGSTSVEVAMKMAIQWFSNQGRPRSRLLALEGGYHGDTFGAMAAGSRSGFFDPFLGMGPEVDFIPYPETWMEDDEVSEKESRALASLERHLSDHPREYAALIMEPLLQGAAGMRTCRPEFVQALVARCRSHGLFIICDEIMTGFYRTGAAFASLLAGITPDIICLSKGLTGGFLPMALTVCTNNIFQGFCGKGFHLALAHGHSFTANPLGCAAAAASLRLLQQPSTLEAVASIQAAHKRHLDQLLQRFPTLRRPRILGTLAAFEVPANDPGYTSSLGPQLRQAFHQRGLLLRPLGNVVYLLPPYCTGERDLADAYTRIADALSDFLPD